MIGTDPKEGSTDDRPEVSDGNLKSRNLSSETSLVTGSGIVDRES